MMFRFAPQRRCRAARMVAWGLVAVLAAAPAAGQLGAAAPGEGAGPRLGRAAPAPGRQPDRPDEDRPDDGRPGYGLRDGDEGARRRDRHRRRRAPTLVIIEDRREAGALTHSTLPRPPASPVAAAPDPGPLDPRPGPRFLAARGTAGAAAVWALGQPLPAGVPHLALTDWRAYGLAPPPPGQAYARVGADLLLIDTADRRVRGALPPPG